MKLLTNSITLALGLAFSAGAMAQNMSKSEYQTAKNQIEAEHKSDAANCGSHADNAKDICMAEAKGKEKIAKAELNARRKNSAKNHYDVHAAKAEAAYAVAKQKCDEKSGNDRDVCVKEAKVVETRAKADAKTRMKATMADKKANKQSAAAHSTADKKKGDAKHDAAHEKSDANYDLAKEKCDDLAGDAKKNCVDHAKQHHGKQ